MTYSRAHPSPRYTELLEQYRLLHTEGEKTLGLAANDTFPGLNVAPQAARIKALTAATGAQTLLDYGSGKGQQYALRTVVTDGGQRFSSLMDYWGVEEVRCYDPSFGPLNTLPGEKFDGVICTDVLEHCPEEDLPWILDEIFSLAERFVFANIAAYLAEKHLPNGENAHCTVKSTNWWNALINQVAAKHPAILWEVWVTTARIHRNQAIKEEERLSNFSYKDR